MTTHAGVAETAHYLRAEGEDLLAIATEPTASLRGAGIVILSGGRHGNTSGRNGVARRLAHRLAAAGFSSVRIDYHGVGDSSGSLEEFVLHQPFLADLEAAVALLRRRGIARIGLIGDCFGARTALAGAAADHDINALLLVSLPWRDLARRDRRAHMISSELSMADYTRRGLRLDTLRKLADTDQRRGMARLATSKVRLMSRRLSDVVGGVEVEPWVSRRVVTQLGDIHKRRTPTLLVYGRGPAEDYTHDFERIRSMPALRWLDDPGVSVRAEVLDQPIAGFRNVVSQDAVVRMAVEWFDTALTPVAEQ